NSGRSDAGSRCGAPRRSVHGRNGSSSRGTPIAINRRISSQEHGLPPRLRPGEGSAAVSMFDLSGQTALVTGASSGLGAHFARVLAKHGAKVAMAARRVERMTALADEIAAAGGRALPIACDVTDSKSIEAAVAAAETELGPVTLLVNNAGVAIPK